MYTKQTVLALLFAGASAKIDKQAAELIVKGILEGAVQAEGLDNIEHCFADGKEIIDDTEIAIKDFEKKDVKDVAEGVKEIGTLIEVAATAVTDCKGVKADLEKLKKMAAVLSSPTSFAYHVGKDLVVNGKSIYKEIDTAIGDYKKQDFEGFGVNVGEAAAKTILGSERATSDAGKKFALVLQGVIKAFGGDFNLEALLACVGDEDKAALALDQAYQQFETAYTDKDFSEAIGGVILTVAGIMQAKQGLAACEAIDKKSWDFTGFIKSGELMSNPTKFFEVHGKDVLINGVSIYKDIGHAVSAWKSADYEKFGESTGDIMKLASAVKKVEKKSVEKRDVASFLQGFLDATSVGHFNFTTLLECIYEVDQDAEILDSVVHMMEDSYKKKDWQEAVGALIGTAALVQQVEQTIPLCKAVDSKTLNWNVYHEIMSTIENKKYSIIEENVIMNGKTITKELSKTLDAWRSGDFQGFGQNLGLTLRATCAPENNLFLF